MLDWMLMPYRRYADFSGRSQRKEYWMFTLLTVIISIVLVGLMFGGMTLGETGEPEMGLLAYLAIGLLAIWGIGSFIPSIAVQVRRFHDQDKSGWFVLLGFIPYLGGLIVLIFMCIEGTKGPNRFGDDPKDPARADVFS